jgi:hypothetical protein
MMTTYDAQMSNTTRRRPPLPVLAALSLLVVGYTAVFALGPWASAAHVIAGLIAAALAAVLIYGMWRGNSFARGLIVLLMAGNLISGFLSHARISGWRAVGMAAALVIAALLLVPRSSRRWFTDPSWGSAPNPCPPKEQPLDTEALWEETDAGERR